MWIAISQRNDKNHHGLWIDNLENNYFNLFEKFGIKLVAIPNVTKNLDLYFEDHLISGIILSGGNDVNPSLYSGKKNEKLCYSVYRDETENKLLKIAIDKKLPVFGICKGMQHINVFFQGKLIQNIKEEVGHNINHVNSDHEVQITDGKTKNILGEKIQTNSYHEQGISSSTLSSDLISFAETSDGIIEGLYHPKLSIAGIQWHPERKGPDNDVNDKIIKMFMNKELFWKI